MKQRKTNTGQPNDNSASSDEGSRVHVDCFVVLSGGLDSTVMTWLLVRRHHMRVRAVFLDYGKPVNRREWESVKLVSLYLGVPLEDIELHGMIKMESGYLPWARVRTDEADVDKGADHLSPVAQDAEEYLQSIAAGRSDWWNVSGFHTMVSVATYLAQITDVRKIALGITKEQVLSYPNLLDFLKKWGKLIEVLNPKAGPFEVLTPLAGLTKSEIVALGDELGVPMHATWSCPNSEGPAHCGDCPRCKERRKAFASANVDDKTHYSK